jgi:hypothetical protein
MPSAIPEVSPAESKAVEKPRLSDSDLFHDSFADVAGATQWNREGTKSFEGPPSNRTIYFFNGMPEGGPLAMRILEDNTALGPDGTPGVLTLSWQQIPPKLPYSGFAYLGGRQADQRLALLPLQQAKSLDDLRPLRLQFRFKGVNEERDAPFSGVVTCRLEPMLAD